MDLGISGKTALVFGGSRGMGRAIAERLSTEGVNVVISGRIGDRTANRQPGALCDFRHHHRSRP